MSTKKPKKELFLWSTIAFIIVQPIFIMGTNLLIHILESEMQITTIPTIKELLVFPKELLGVQLLLLFNIIAILSVVGLMFYDKKSLIKYKMNTIQITDTIAIPMPSDNPICGSSRFLDKKEFDNKFESIHIDKKNPIVKKLMKGQYVGDVKLFDSAGLILGSEITENGEKIYCVKDDLHSLILGATRSGKTRTVILQTIAMLGLAGENMFTLDPKGELFCYTKNFLENLAYEVPVMDFQNPLKSTKCNFLQPVIDFVNEDKMSEASDSVADIVSMLVGETKGEPIWNNGEMSIIAFAILLIVIENKDRPQYQNLTNVYYFLAEQCQSDAKGKMPLNNYIKKLPKDHPAKVKAAISTVAPEKTRGSFFTSALGTLQLFANPSIYEMTRTTELDLKEVDKKRAIFLIVPDETSKYDKLAALFLANYYTTIVKQAKEGKNGVGSNRLPIRVNFNCDEFGNIPPIVDMGKKLTVSAGYGIRFNFAVQSYSQITQVYSTEMLTTFKNNCETTVYLKSLESDTLEELSRRLKTYTVKVSSEGASINSGGSSGGGSYSSNTNYQARELLNAEEIGRIERPYSLIIQATQKAITTAPDISQYTFNKMFGLGSKEHNQQVIKNAQDSRKTIENVKMDIWEECFVDETPELTLDEEMALKNKKNDSKIDEKNNSENETQKTKVDENTFKF